MEGPLRSEAGRPGPSHLTKRPSPRDGRADTGIGTIIDLVWAGNATIPFTARDAKAVKESRAPPELIAEAYLAAYHGEWGDEWLRENLTLRLVVDRLSGYCASKIPAARPATRGSNQRTHWSASSNENAKPKLVPNRITT